MKAKLVIVLFVVFAVAFVLLACAMPGPINGTLVPVLLGTATP